MKKCTSFILALLMLVSGTGLAFTVHFCGEDIASVSSVFTATTDNDGMAEACCIEKAKENKSCCSDKVVKIKAKAEVVTKTFSFTPDMICQQIFDIPYRIASVAFFDSDSNTRYKGHPNAPPLYKLYHQYIFYA